MELLRTLTESKGHAAVVVSHDPRLLEVADRNSGSPMAG